MSHIRRRRGLGRFLPTHSRKAGLAPGTVVHTAEEPPPDEVTMVVTDFDAERHQSRPVERIAEVVAVRERPTVTWLNVDGVHDVALLEEIGEAFGLHPLVVEDIAHPGQRPKVEDYRDYLYLVLRMLTYDEAAAEVRDEQVSLVVGEDYLLSFQERSGDVFEGVRARLRSPGAPVRGQGPDYLAYRLMDAVVDNYFVLLERLGYRLDDLEDALIEEPERSTLQEIYRMKRELLFFRKSVWPLREVIGALQRDTSPLIAEGTRTYLRDLFDHTIQAVDMAETYRDILAGMLDTYLSSLSNRMNEVMKVLTVVATIFIPLTFLTGVYGMNFEHMPELAEPWAYPALWGVMVVLGGGMLAYFRHRDWI